MSSSQDNGHHDKHESISLGLDLNAQITELLDMLPESLDPTQLRDLRNMVRGLRPPADGNVEALKTVLEAIVLHMERHADFCSDAAAEEVMKLTRYVDSLPKHNV